MLSKWPDPMFEPTCDHVSYQHAGPHIKPQVISFLISPCVYVLYAQCQRERERYRGGERERDRACVQNGYHAHMQAERELKVGGGGWRGLSSSRCGV